MPALPFSRVAQVIVPVPDMGVLDYGIPEGMTIRRGDRVWVKIRRRSTVGIVVDVKTSSDCPPEKLKGIEAVLDVTGPMNESWLAMTAFVSHYYLRAWGEVSLRALPAVLKKIPTAREWQRIEKYRQRPPLKAKPDQPPILNDEQRNIVDRLIEQDHFQVNVLFGVTGSGKTEVYLHWMSALLKKDPTAQILFLVPEINLTPQLEDKLRSRFHDVPIYTMHSSLTPSERLNSWLAAHEGRARILIGTRLAALASMPHLKGIVVDEEHDLSYKARDGSRFHARDLAIWRAHYENCPIVLGSATPSLETWARCEKKKYTCWRLASRAVQGASLPTLTTVPYPPYGAQSPFHGIIESKIEATLQKGEQVLVFINRRGYSPQIMCEACGWVSACDHCSSKTVFHKREHALICHHCGTRYPVVKACPTCGNQDLTPVGIGTERLEEALIERFPHARLIRIDRDSVSTKKRADKAFQAMHEGEVDILVGTQMVAKGHDFKRVSLVVVMNADAGLMAHDPRVKERLFATLIQVSGRAGRHNVPGEVLVQTAYPRDPLFADLARQDYEGFAHRELELRRKLMSPPYVYQALLTAQAYHLEEVIGFLKEAKALVKQVCSSSVMVYDPVPMAFMRLQDLERGQLLIESTSRSALHRFLWDWIPLLKGCTPTDWQIEVDPAVV